MDVGKYCNGQNREVCLFWNQEEVTFNVSLCD